MGTRVAYIGGSHVGKSVVCDPEVFLGVSEEVFIDSAVIRVHRHTAGAPRKNKAYDSRALIETIHDHGAWVVISPRANSQYPREFNPQVYRARNLVARFFNRIKRIPMCHHTLR